MTQFNYTNIRQYRRQSRTRLIFNKSTSTINKRLKTGIRSKNTFKSRTNTCSQRLTMLQKVTNLDIKISSCEKEEKLTKLEVWARVKNESKLSIITFEAKRRTVFMILNSYNEDFYSAAETREIVENRKLQKESKSSIISSKFCLCAKTGNKNE